MTQDVQSDDRFRRPDLARALGLRGMIAVPIPSYESGRPPVGCITVYTTRFGDRFSEDHVRLLENIADFVAVAHSNLRKTLELTSWRDALAKCREHAQTETLDEICLWIRDLIGAKSVSLFGVCSTDLRLEGTTGLYTVHRPADYARVVIPINGGSRPGGSRRPVRRCAWPTARKTTS